MFKKIAEQKLQQIELKIKDLTTLRNTLDALLKDCQKNQSTEHCSLIDALSFQADSKI